MPEENLVSHGMLRNFAVTLLGVQIGVCVAAMLGGRNNFIFSSLGKEIYFQAKMFHCFSHSTMAAMETLL